MLSRDGLFVPFLIVWVSEYLKIVLFLVGNANMMNCYAYFVVKEDINRHCKVSLYLYVYMYKYLL